MLNVKDFGARGDGTGDDAPAIQAAINALSHCGILFLPSGVYRTLSAISPGNKAVIFQGEGWQLWPQDAFGHANWHATGAVRGTVIRCDGPHDGLQITGNEPPFTYQGLQLRDLCFLGPGTGTSKGINYTSTSSVDIDYKNVGVFNFSTGIRFASTLTNFAHKLKVLGCTTGIHFAEELTDFRLCRVEVQSCGVGILVNAGTGMAICGGLIQNNGIGIKVAPTVSGTGCWHFDSIWFESNTSKAFLIDTTDESITQISLSRSRFSESLGADVIAFAGGNILNFLTLAFNTAGGATVTLPSTAFNTVLMGNNFGVQPVDGGDNGRVARIMQGPNELDDLAGKRLALYDAASGVWRTLTVSAGSLVIT